jgi:hypothetical protein
VEVLTNDAIEVQHVHHTSLGHPGLIISTPGIWLREKLLEIDPNDPMSPSVQEAINKNFIAQMKKEVEKEYDEKFSRLVKNLQQDIAQKALKKMEFEAGKVYMILVDPTMIDIESLATMDMSDFPVFNVVFIPVNQTGGKSLEDATVFKETVENITDWLSKTMKCKILLLPDEES